MNHEVVRSIFRICVGGGVEPFLPWMTKTRLIRLLWYPHCGG
jgi:hypothetical protein